MVFGLRLFSGGSPTKRGVDPNAPRIADRVEGGTEEAAAANAASAATADPNEAVEIPLGAPSETITSGASGVTAMPISAASSARTLLPSVSAVVLGPDAGPALDGEGDLHSVPLTAIPDFVINEHPELKLTPYNFDRSTHCSNAIAMPHNAARLEMADMWSDILPSLRSRPIEALTRDDGSDLTQWWGGFARFVLTTSLVDDHIVTCAYKDILEDFDKAALEIRRSRRKFEEKNAVTLEIVCRAMGRAVELFVEHMSASALDDLVLAWQQLSSVLTDIYALSEKILIDVDRWRREDPAEHKDLEKQIAKVYTNKKRWGADDTKRGEMIVVLTRWVGSEHLMREWMDRNLTKKELRSIDRWMDDYRANRLQLIDSFHQRRAL